MFDSIKLFIKSTINSLKSIKLLYFYILCGLYDIIKFGLGHDYPDLEEESKEELKELKEALATLKFERYLEIFFHKILLELDYKEIKSGFNFYKLNKKNIKILPRFYYRSKNYKIESFFENKDYSYFLRTTKSNLWFGLRSLWLVLRMWIISLFFFFVSLYFMSFVRVLPVNTVLFQWFAMGMFTYWLISGFVFFIKKYRFGKFTAAVQRFWRRSYILFWLIESCLLIVFVYLTLNATQETSYMLDQISVLKTHLFSWRAFLPKLFLNTFLVIFSYLLLLNVKWNLFKKNMFFTSIITALLTYMLWIEFYQIYHVSNFYSNLFWSYDLDERLWSLESDVRRTRITNHYVMILFLLKFWHIVFIYVFWIFFILRSSELERIRYPLYSANFQNFIILYIMSWIFMYPWLKIVSQKFLSTPYFWFYVNNRELGFRIFFYDIKLVIYALQNNINFDKFNLFTNFDFYYWTIYNNENNYETFRKHIIKDIIVKKLTTF